jgi:hypothetical protein
VVVQTSPEDFLTNHAASSATANELVHNAIAVATMLANQEFLHIESPPLLSAEPQLYPECFKIELATDAGSEGCINVSLTVK